MKVKLLKKIRKRFKWKYLGFDMDKPFPRQLWEVKDSKGTEIENLEHVSHMGYGDMIRIHSPTIAEQLVMDLMGIMFVYNHRQHRAKMKNKSFKKKYFNES